MSRSFAVLRTRTAGWDAAVPLRQQPLWREHATFIDGLVDEGVIRLAGPLDGSPDVLLIMSGDDPAAVEARLAEDPWTGGLLRTTWIRPWNVLVGELV